MGRERDKIIFSLSGAELELWERHGGRMNDAMWAELRRWWRTEERRAVDRAAERLALRVKVRIETLRDRRRSLAKMRARAMVERLAHRPAA